MPEPVVGSLQSYYVWEPPSHGITVLLNLRLIEGMKAWIDQAHRSGQETGGILLGSIEQDSLGQRIVTIEDCAAIRIPHRSGSQFTLAAGSARPIENAVTRWRGQRATSVTPVGFTRSHLRPGLYLDPADFALFWNYFPDPCSVFLLVRPGPESLAGFFFWERGELHRQDSYLQFPFDPQKLSRDASHTVLRGPSLAANGRQKSGPHAPQRLPAPASSSFRLKLSVQPGDGPRLGWIGATLAILFLSAILWQPSTAVRGSAPRPSSELGLNIDHLGPALRLTWNPHASVVENATHGILWVSDGSARKKIELDGKQLAHGSVMYVPESDQVEFRLQVDSQGKPVANSILSLAPATRPELADVVPPAPAVPAEEEQSTTPPKSSVHPIQERAPSVTASSAPSPTPPAAEKPAAIAKEEPAAVTVPKPDPPSSFVRQPLPSVSLSYEYAPLPERARRKGIDKIPVIRLFHRHPKPEPASAKSETVVPAKPLQAFKPHVPSDVARALPGDWRVDVKASIDEKGRVLQLEPLSSTMDPRLVRLVMNAVNDWDFEPANIDGRAIKSGLVVTFRFHIPSEAESERSANRH